MSVPRFGIIAVVAAAFLVQCVCAVPLTDFFPFGYKFGDEVLLPGNNASASQELKVSFPFYGKSREFITVLTDGQIHLSEDKRRQSSGVMIYPFSGDVDTTSIGEVFYRETDDPQLLKRAALVMESAFPGVDDPSPTSLFIATWFYVGYFQGHNDKTNTFQCVLATNGTVSYAMFLYVDGHMQWTAYDTDTKGQATMGFESEKRSNTFYTSDADKDHVNDIDLTSNSGTPGLWIFMDDGLQILQPTTALPVQSFIPEFIERRFQRDVFSGDGPPIEPPADPTFIFVGLEQATYSVDEGNSINICVAAESSTQPTQPVTVTITLNLISASPNDFTFESTPTTRVITSVPSLMCLPLGAVNDDTCEGTETLEVIISIAGAFVSRGLCLSTVTILDTTIPQQGVDFRAFFPHDPNTDIPLPPTDDGFSPLIQIPLPFFPFSNNVLLSVSVAANGVISFETQWPFFDPDPFPTNFFATRNTFVVAPFWADIDTRFRGSITYNTYTACTQQGAALLNEASSFINNNQQLQQDPFTGRWMLIATWYDVHPYPDGLRPLPSFFDFLTDFIELSNTFQAVIITDGVRSFAIFLYDCSLMEWSGRELTLTNNLFATIGFNAFGQDFLNLPFTGTPLANQIACTNQACGQNLATYVIPLAQNQNALQLQRRECFDYYKTDVLSFPPISPFLSIFSGIQCPCNVFQAIFDRRFAGFFFEGRACFVNIFPARNFRFFRGSDAFCCYSLSTFPRFGSLIQSGNFISTAARFNLFFETSNWFNFDFNFRRACCLNGAGGCGLFIERRPQRGCFFYRPPRRGWGWGDPHFRTIDEGRYTFNGLGEFVILEVEVPDENVMFVLQGRTRVIDPVDGTQDGEATEFIAFAVGLRGLGANVTVELRATGDTFDVLLDGVDISANLTNVNDTVLESGGNVQITQIEEGEFQVAFSIGLGALFQQSGGVANYILDLSDDVVGLTTGLLGNFNNDSSDDFVLRNGSTLSENATDRSIHFDFGLTWQITQDESMFTYESGESVATFANASFVPAFASDVVVSDEVMEACQGDSECIYDTIQTGDQNIGMATLMLDGNNTETQVITENNPPMLNGSETFMITVNTLSTYTFTATDTNDFTVATLLQIPEDSSLTEVSDNNFEFSITLDQVSAISVGFIATDTQQATATLEPQIQICACLNSGTCTLEGIADPMASPVILNCVCAAGYTGQFCETDIDGCVASVCFPGVECIDNPPPAEDGTCGACPVGFTGDGVNCVDVNECGALDLDNCSQICTNTMGSFDCSCTTGFTEDGSLCIDIDECSGPNGCQQICSNTQGSFVCSCQPGFMLATNGLDCDVMPGSECVDRLPFCSNDCFRTLLGDAPSAVTLEFCICPSGFQLGLDGLLCENVDECLLSPCEQNCADSDGSFSCSCNAGFVLDNDGTSCNDVDECMEAMMLGSMPCDAGLMCVNTVGSFICVCPPGTELINGTCQVVTVSFAATSITVGEDETSATVCIDISGGLVGDITVLLSSTDASATAGEDYVAVTDLPITFDFAPSQICVDVCVVQDRDIELASEQFSLQLTPPQQIGGNLILATDFIFVFILDRTVVEVAFSQSVYEAVECAGCNVTVCVDIRMADLQRNVLVSLSTMNGMAEAGLDYEGVGNQVIQFSSAPETICLDIGILPDDVIEGSEGFLVNLESTDPRVELTVAQARIVIADSSVATIEIVEAAYTAEEGTLVSVCANLTSGTLARSISASLSTGDITATAPDDYVAVSDFPLVFDSLTSSIQCVNISVEPDALADPGEQFAVLLASDDPAVDIERSLAIVNIEESSPVIEIGFTTDTVLVGEDEGVLSLCIVVTGIIPSMASINFSVEAQNGTAIDGQDFEDLGVIIHFNGNSDNSLGDSDPSAGAILFCLPVVQILNNLFVDGDVYFSISGEVQTDLAVEITQGSVAVHISDDDSATAYLTQGTFSISESDAARGLAVYVCAYLEANLTRNLVLTLSSRSNTAIEGMDLREQNQSLLYTPNSPPVQCTGFTVIDDTILEEPESFFIDITSDDPAFDIALSQRPTATVFIEDDDTVTIGFTMSSYTVMESALVVTVDVAVLVAGGLERTVQVDLSTLDGTALDTVDYVGIASRTLEFDSQTQQVSVNITLLDDQVFGAMIETFSVVLDTSDDDVILDPATAIVNIVEDEDVVVAMFSQDLYVEQEGNSVQVCLQLMGVAQVTINFEITATDITATDGDDYVSGGVRQLVFFPGDTEECVMYDLLDDGDLEPADETFNVTASSTNPIVDIPFPPAIVRIEDATTVEIGWFQTEYFVAEAQPFVVACTTQSPAGPTPARPITIDATTVDGTAMEGADYVMTTRSFDYVSAGVLHCMVIPLRDDQLLEGTESFTLILSTSDTAVTLNPQTATVFIADDES